MQEQSVIHIAFYPQMKPSDLLLNVAGVKNSIETGQAVAKLVKKYKMHKQVIVISFNYFATLSAKRVSHLMVCSLFNTTNDMQENPTAVPDFLISIVPTDLSSACENFDTVATRE